MKKMLLLCGALLVLSACSAISAGINLSYDDCGTFGTGTRTFACDTNVGTNAMFASFVAPAGITEYASCEAELEIQTDSAALPDWWKFRNTGTCRRTSLATNFNFTAGPFNCTDAWLGGATGSIAVYEIAYLGLNRSRIKVVVALPHGRDPLPEGFEYYAFKLSFNNEKSVGTGSCAGCAIGACINLRFIKLIQTVTLHDDRILTNPANRAHVRWQAASDVACLGATPAHNTTWGAVKALYR